MKMVKKLGAALRCATVAATTTLVLSTSAQAMSAWDDYSSFWVLGDSLSDTGNLAAATGGAFPGPAYYENRFSNGPIWADFFLDRFIAAGKPAASIAFGGATATTNLDTIPDIGAQSLILRAQSVGLLGARPLMAIWRSVCWMSHRIS